MGKGSAINGHLGNKRLRSVVELRKPKFLETKREAKRGFAEEIVRDVETSGGRFLAEDHNNRTSTSNTTIIAGCEKNKKRATRNNNGSTRRPPKRTNSGDDASSPEKDGLVVTDPSILDKVWVQVEKEKAIDKVMHRLREKDNTKTSVGKKQQHQPTATTSESRNSGLHEHHLPKNGNAGMNAGILSSSAKAGSHDFEGQYESHVNSRLGAGIASHSKAVSHDVKEAPLRATSNADMPEYKFKQGGACQAQAPFMAGIQPMLLPLATDKTPMTSGVMHAPTQIASTQAALGLYYDIQQHASKSGMTPGLTSYVKAGSQHDPNKLLQRTSNSMKGYESRQGFICPIQAPKPMAGTQSMLPTAANTNEYSMASGFGIHSKLPSLAASLVSSGFTHPPTQQVVSTQAALQSQATNFPATQVAGVAHTRVPASVYSPSKHPAKQDKLGEDKNLAPRVPVPMSIQYWIKSTLALLSHSNTEDYIKIAVHLSWRMTKHLMKLIASSAEIIALHDISVERVVLFVEPPPPPASPAAMQNQQYNTPIMGLIIRDIQFQRGMTPLPTASRRRVPRTPLCSRAVCAAMGSILLVSG